MSPNPVKRATTFMFAVWLAVLAWTLIFPSDAGGEEKECHIQWTEEDEKKLRAHRRWFQLHPHLRETQVWEQVYRFYILLLDAKHDPCGSKGERL